MLGRQGGGREGRLTSNAMNGGRWGVVQVLWPPGHLGAWSGDDLFARGKLLGGRVGCVSDFQEGLADKFDCLIESLF